MDAAGDARSGGSALRKEKSRWDFQIYPTRLARCVFHVLAVHVPRRPSYLSARKLLFYHVRVSHIKREPLSPPFLLFLPVFQAMLSLPDTSSPSCMPVFDVHPNHQDRLDRFQGSCYDKANACATSQLAAGSIPSPPFPSTNPPSLDIYSFDQWTSLLNSDISSDLHSGYCLGYSVSDPSFSFGSQDSVLSSPNSSYVTLNSLLTPCTVLPRTLARPHHQWHRLWGTTVYCILLPQTCSHTIRRAPSK